MRQNICDESKGGLYEIRGKELLMVGEMCSSDPVGHHAQAWNWHGSRVGVAVVLGI